MESLIDFVRCNNPGIIDVEISETGNIEQNSWRENRLCNRFMVRIYRISQRGCNLK